MKVKDVIKIFQERDPEEEILIDWWDRECFFRIFEEDYPSVEAWVKVVSQWDEKNISSMLNNDVWEWINDALIEEA
jgi:hypothetical protein